MPHDPAASDVFSAIADPRRRQIIDLLSRRRGLSVGAIVLALRLAQPAVSKHLGVLREAGIVSATKNGKVRMYELKLDQLRTIQDWVQMLEKHWENQIDRIWARAEQRPLLRHGRVTHPHERKIMATDASTPQSIAAIEILKTVDIAAPIEIAFEAMLDELGPDAQMMDGTAMPFKLETWPGGRWFRDLGSNKGHLWGHVQVIKPPTLLEICGPLMMSFPAMNHIQYRFAAQGNGTRLTFTHRGIGAIAPDFRDGMVKGWGHWTEKIGRRAEQKSK